MEFSINSSINIIVGLSLFDGKKERKSTIFYRTVMIEFYALYYRAINSK